MTPLDIHTSNIIADGLPISYTDALLEQILAELRGLKAADAKLAEACDEIRDWRVSAAKADMETCGSAEHCTCVGLLRGSIDELATERDALQAELNAIKAALGVLHAPRERVLEVAGSQDALEEQVEAVCRERDALQAKLDSHKDALFQVQNAAMGLQARLDALDRLLARIRPGSEIAWWVHQKLVLIAGPQLPKRSGRMLADFAGPEEDGA